MLHKSTGSPGNDIYLLKNSNAIEIVLRSPYNEASRAPPGHAGPSKDGLGTVDVTLVVIEVRMMIMRIMRMSIMGK